MDHNTTRLRARVREYLKRPYRREVIPDEESGTYFARIAEFPGCFTEAASAGSAIRKLERVAESWIEAALEMGQAIPDPDGAPAEYSGKTVLRMPRSLHRKLAELARRDQVSLNGYIVAVLAENVGMVRQKAATSLTDSQWVVQSYRPTAIMMTSSEGAVLSSVTALVHSESSITSRDFGSYLNKEEKWHAGSEKSCLLV